MTFDEAQLLENIHASVHLIHMHHIISAGWDRPRSPGADEVAAALARAAFFTSAFEFAWDSLLSRDILRMKVEFAERRDIFDLLRAVLPDLFCSRRQAMHRARWKDLWKDKPSSVNEFELAVSKLMEQAFWAIATDSCSAVAVVDPIFPEVLSDGWMSDSGVQMQKSGKEASKKTCKSSKRMLQSRKASSGKSTSLQDKTGCQQRQAVATESENKDVPHTRQQPCTTPSDAARTLIREQTLSIGVQPEKSEATTSQALVESAHQVIQSETTAAKATAQAPQSLEAIVLPSKLPSDEQEHTRYFPCIVPMEQLSSMVASGAVPIAQVSQEQASQLASGSLSLDMLLGGGHTIDDPNLVLYRPLTDQLKQVRDGGNQVCAGSSDDVQSFMGEPESCGIHDDSSTCSGASSLHESSFSQSPMSSPSEAACLGVQGQMALSQQQGDRLQRSSNVFIKNTFIDFDDGISKARHTRARSWSPSPSFNVSAGPHMLKHLTETSWGR